VFPPSRTMETRYEPLLSAAFAFARCLADFRLRPNGASTVEDRACVRTSRTKSDAIRGVRTREDDVAISGLLAFRGELNCLVPFAWAFPWKRDVIRPRDGTAAAPIVPKLLRQ
jgi:hypothetical protein